LLTAILSTFPPVKAFRKLGALGSDLNYCGKRFEPLDDSNGLNVTGIQKNGAGDRGRTGDVQLGKLAFYH
jgi:hypothetical protein